MAVTLLPMLVLVSVRNLKYLSPVSMFANLLQFTGLGITFYYLLMDIPQVSERKYVARWDPLSLMDQKFLIIMIIFPASPSFLSTLELQSMPLRASALFFLWRTR